MEKDQKPSAVDEAVKKRRRHIYTIIINVLSVMGVIACVLLIYYLYRAGMMTDKEKMEGFLIALGVWGPLFFTVYQGVQVIVPIMPGAIGCVVGVVVFGPWMGFLYNYIGICAGSIGAFFLSRRFGRPLVEFVADEKVYEKYMNWLDKSQPVFDKLFAAAIFFPVAPDDFLCYLAGITKMGWKKFVVIILTGKPLAIAAYSMLLGLGLEWLLNNLHLA